jgi:hypothetical protein
MMRNLEYSESIPKRHRLPLESCRCERNDLEKYYCKGCNFETDLFVILKKHLKEYHGNDADCVQDEPRNDAVVKSYICRKCSFETYSCLLWIKHLESPCFDAEEECEKTKEATVLERHHTAKQSIRQKERFRCLHCKYKGRTKDLLRYHVNYKHATLEAVHWFHCNECQFTSKSYCSLYNHKNRQHSADVVYNCDKCEYKTKRADHLKRHKKNHLPEDAVTWYRCDKCNFKAKRKDCLRKHQKNHLSPDANQWYNCDKCKFKTTKKQLSKTT